MTIRVVLADDEPLIVKGLHKLIPWEQMDLDIVAQAYDGQELLEMIDQHHPDIVISDISMPHLTGIDIIKEVNRRHLAVKVIFISAYQEFIYAKDAVAYGAVDYLVKPIKKEELESVLSRTVSLIMTENEQAQRKGKLQFLERKNRDEEMRDWLILLTDGALSPQSEALLAIKERLAGPYYSIGIIQVDQLNQETERWPVQEKKLVHFAIENIVNEMISEYGRGYVFIENHRQIFVIDHERREQAQRLAEDIHDKINVYLKLKVSIGISEPVPEIEKLSEAYLQADHALQLIYFMGLNRVIPYRVERPKQELEIELYSLQSEVIRTMTSHAWNDARAALQLLLSTIEAATRGNRTLAVTTCFSSVLYMIQEIKKSGVALSDWGFDIHNLQSQLGQYDTFAAMGQGIYHILEELYDRIDDQAGNKEKLLMARIKKYIEEHFAEEITLDSVASLAFMNPYYFSSFFKKHTEQNFKQYVTEVRMNQAIRLLTQTDMMVYEIADQVGYNNARHFSDMFKKLYGKLPQEYRQIAKKGK